MKLEDFQNLPAHDKAIVCLALLLDDTEAVAFMQLNSKKGALYTECLEMFINMQDDMKVSLASTILRDALNEL